MVYIRGHAFDYDRWQAEGCDGWSYADCLPYFKKAQNHCLGNEIFYGHGFIGYPKGRNVERALGPSCPCVLCISHSLGLNLLHQI